MLIIPAGFCYSGRRLDQYNADDVFIQFFIVYKFSNYKFTSN